jgi:hypothetical protein
LEHAPFHVSIGRKTCLKPRTLKSIAKAVQRPGILAAPLTQWQFPPR